MSHKIGINGFHIDPKSTFILQVNPQWSMDLAAKIPIIEVNTKVVACDGGGGALGHPR